MSDNNDLQKSVLDSYVLGMLRNISYLDRAASYAGYKNAVMALYGHLKDSELGEYLKTQVELLSV